MTHWVQIASGAAFPLLDPGPQHVDWRAVAEALAKLPRFNGHTPGTVYSVAQHSLLVARIAEGMAPEACDEARRGIALYGLIHDAHEAILGDIVTPVSQAIAALAGTDAVAALKAAVDAAMFAAAGLPWPPPAPWRAIVEHADAVALATERRDLLAAPARPWARSLPHPLAFKVKPVPWHQAMDRWDARLRALLPTTPRREAVA